MSCTTEFHRLDKYSQTLIQYFKYSIQDASTRYSINIKSDRKTYFVPLRTTDPSCNIQSRPDSSVPCLQSYIRLDTVHDANIAGSPMQKGCPSLQNRYDTLLGFSWLLCVKYGLQESESVIFFSNSNYLPLHHQHHPPRQ